MMKTWIYRSSRLEVFYKNGVLTYFPKFVKKHKHQTEGYNTINKDTLAHMFSCKYCEIFKNIYFMEHLQKSASEFTFQNDYTEVRSIFNKIWEAK